MVHGNYWHAGDVSEGLARVSTGKYAHLDHWGFVDAQGRLVIRCAFKEAGDFSDGMCAVIPRGKKLWGCIDKTGALKIPAEYDEVTPFGDGLAAVRKGVDWSYVTRKGVVAFPSKYGSAGRFSEGRAPVSIKGKGGASTGKAQWPSIRSTTAHAIFPMDGEGSFAKERPAS